MKKRFYFKGFKIFLSNGHRFRFGGHRSTTHGFYIWLYLGTWQLGIWDRRSR